MFDVNEIRSQLALGGARPTSFRVTIQNPVNSIADIKVPFLCEAASIPPASLGTIQVPYFGRTIKLAGDRVYPPWQVMIISDEDHLIRNAMEQWSNAINTFRGNLRALGSSSPLLYKAKAEVLHLSKTGLPLRSYTFDGIYPAEVGQIELAWSAQNQYMRFSVTFEYDWWEVNGNTGDAGGA